jgi:hypothetical protein
MQLLVLRISRECTMKGYYVLMKMKVKKSL